MGILNSVYSKSVGLKIYGCSKFEGTQNVMVFPLYLIITIGTSLLLSGVWGLFSTGVMHFLAVIGGGGSFLFS